MYRVLIRQKWDGEETLINSDVGDRPRILAGQITKAVGSFDTFSMTLDPTNPGYGQLSPLQTFVRVVRQPPANVLTLFEGRITTIQPSMGSDGIIETQAEAEGLTAFLHDSIQPWAEFHDTTPRAFLQALIDQHNKQVEPYKQIKLGTVKVTNSTDNVYRYTDDTKDTYDTIQDKLISRLGGELQVRHEEDGLYLDYMPLIGADGNQVIRLQSNLLSLTSKIDPTDVITVLKPLGATQEPEEATTGDGTASADATQADNFKMDDPKENDTEADTAQADTTQTSNPRLTIESVNDKSPFLVDKDLYAQFGYQGGAVTWDDVKVPANLLTKGKEWFKTQRAALETVQISAIDLNLVGQNVDEFVCGNSYRVICDLMPFNKVLRFVGISIDIVAPLNSTISAGDLALSSEDYSLSMYRAAQRVDDLNGVIVPLKKTVGVHGVEIKDLSVASKKAEETLTALKPTIEKLQKEADDAGLGTLSDTLGQFTNQTDSLFKNIGDMGAEIKTLQDGQKTSTGATLETLEARVKVLEDAGTKPAAGTDTPPATGGTN